MTTRKALLVGVDSYRYLRKLKGCTNDVVALGELLVTPSFGFEVEALLNERAKRGAFRQSIDAALIDSDFTLLYFAGHGIRTKTATYLATADHEPGDEGVDITYFQQAIRRLLRPGQTVLLVLDCCHAGDGTVEPLVDGSTPLQLTDIPSFLGTGIVLLAACGGDQRSKETVVSGRSHGIFTASLIEALSGKAASPSRVVTVSAVYEYVSAELEKLGEQRPKFSGDQNGRIIIATGVEPTGEAVQEPRRLTSEMAREADSLITAYFEATPKLSRDQYLSDGHRDACQRLEPIVEWFAKRLRETPALRADALFAKAFAEMHQQYQLLSTIAPGTVLDKARKVENYVGGGTFGSVWVIEDPARTSKSCFKAFHSSELRDDDKVARFERGFRAMTQMSHPNIVKVFELSRVPLGFFMDFIDGPNLRKYNPATSLDFPQIIELLLFVAETIRHAHGRKVLHRDVKPENILLSFEESGRTLAHLTDFDLSWFSTATKLTKIAGDGFGSHFYAAPEQMNSPTSAAAHKETVDAYSFGQVLYFCIAGRDPGMFDEVGNSKTLSEKLSRLPISEQTARATLNLYQSCTRHDHSMREGDFGVVCSRLSEILAGAREIAEDLTGDRFLQELRYMVVGLDASGDTTQPVGFVEFRSPSGRTDISVRIKRETETVLALEATFYANQIVIEGLNAVDTRTKVNTRIDAAIASFARSHSAVRTPGKSGAFSSFVNFDAIQKSPAGVTRAREIIMATVDAIERT